VAAQPTRAPGAALLETTDASIDTIAARTGMGAAATLRRHFNRSVGVAPDTYRRTFPGPPHIAVLTGY
jgi:transcriptional regulator GlxA family with amidase domain